MASCFRYGFIVLAAVLCSVQVTASELTPIIDPGTGAKVYVPSSDGLRQSRTFTSSANVTGVGQVKLPTTYTKHLGWPKVGNIVKSTLRSSPQAIISAVAIGYLIEQIPGGAVVDGQPVKTVNGSIIPMGQTSTQYFWEFQVSPFPRGSTPTDSCQAYLATRQASYVIYSVTKVSETQYQCRWGSQYGVFTDNVLRKGSSCPSGSVYDSTVGACRGTSQVPFTTSDYDSLGNSVANLPSSYWPDFAPIVGDIPGSFDYPDSTAFTGPPSVDLPSTTTTTSNPTTGDVTVVETVPSVRFDYSSSPLSISATPTTTTTTYQNGTVKNTSTTTTNNTTNSNVTITPPKTEVPTDCAFMPTVCQFIDWVKQPFTDEPPDFAELIDDEDFAESVTISGNATCPSPTMIETNLGSFEFSWQPACTWAGMIKPLVVIAALIAAIYISLGIGRPD